MKPSLQELVLRDVRQRGPDCRADEVQERLTALLGKEQSFGAIFTTLDRLTAKGLVKWVKGQPDNPKGGRAPRLYTITALGAQALSDAAKLRMGGDQEWSGREQPAPGVGAIR